MRVKYSLKKWNYRDLIRYVLLTYKDEVSKRRRGAIWGPKAGHSEQE